MHIIYLPGNSPSNQNWVESVKSHFDTFSPGTILNYSHWPEGRGLADLAVESAKLSQIVADQSQYSVFAKSIGTLLALKNISEHHFAPQKAIFCGLPYSLAIKLNLPIDNYLTSLSIPTIFVQNEFDPVGSAADLGSILSSHPPTDYRLIVNPANSTHDYENYDQLVSLAKDFFAS